jgi:opacity protein-like surface antigen
MALNMKLKFLVLVVSLMSSSSAFAGEGLFGWIYTLDLQPKGKYEFEQRAQLNHKQNGAYDNLKLRTEIEYGLTDNIQLGGYVNSNYINANQNDKFGATAGGDIPESINTNKRYRHSRVESVSFETIWRITNPVVDPIGIGLYIEPEIGPYIKELEARLLLQKNLLDDRLILASNLVFTTEKDSYMSQENPEKASHFDLLAGASYRFASNWNAGFDYRFHNDYAGYFYQSSTQHAHFIGPNLHYANEKWWVTAAWRHQISGTCKNAGVDECANGFVMDDHGREEFMLKFGMPF